MLMPLDQHFDGGLGATGRSFEESANLLSASSASKDIRLPICFLYRHAIELYLKSVIVVMHRALKVPYGSTPYDGSAHVIVDGKWLPIYRVHSVAILWSHALGLIRDSKSALEERCKTDWQAVPEELIRSIEEIELIDGSSTFFRYPDNRRPDAEQMKSMWKEKGLDSVQFGVPPEAKPTKLFLLVDQDDQISQAFEYDDDTLSEVVKLLKGTAEILSGLHFGLRVELAGGF